MLPKIEAISEALTKFSFKNWILRYYVQKAKYFKNREVRLGKSWEFWS